MELALGEHRLCPDGAFFVDLAVAVDADRVLDELMTEDFVMYFNNQSEAAASHGLDAHKTFMRRHAQNFTGACWMVETLLADEATVACQWRIQATHVPSGNPIDVRAADMYRLRDGRLAKLRRFLDFRSLGEQGAARYRI